MLVPCLELLSHNKELVNQAKAMKSHLPGHKDRRCDFMAFTWFTDSLLCERSSTRMVKSFFKVFSLPFPTAGGTSTAKSQGREEITMAEDSKTYYTRPVAQMKISTHTQFKIFDNRFQKYVDESYSVSRKNSP